MHNDHDDAIVDLMVVHNLAYERKYKGNRRKPLTAAARIERWLYAAVLGAVPTSPDVLAAQVMYVYKIATNEKKLGNDDNGPELLIENLRQSVRLQPA